MYEIVATPAFKHCLNRLCFFLTKKYSDDFAKITKKKIKKTIQDNLSENPYIAPVSNRLLDIGIPDFRQYVLDDHNILFYQVDDELEQVRLIAIMDSRQSIQKLLSEILLLL